MRKIRQEQKINEAKEVITDKVTKEIKKFVQKDITLII